MLNLIQHPHTGIYGTGSKSISNSPDAKGGLTFTGRADPGIGAEYISYKIVFMIN